MNIPYVFGRPIKYSDEMLIKAQEYLNSCEDKMVNLGTEDKPFYKLKVNIPTRAGMANYLDINKDTLNEWSKEYKDLSVIIGKLDTLQEHKLVNGGLSSDYNSTIAKVLLVKHGYRDAQEITGAEGKDLFNKETKEKIENSINTFLDGRNKENTN